jgi:hypothetical protein
MVKIAQLPVDEIIEWDVLNWSQLIRFWTPIVSNLPKNSNILAIGERNGGLSTWLALLGHNVVCTDREFPRQAQAEHYRLGVSQKITYGQLDIVNCERSSGKFDMIIGKSVIGGLKSNPADRKTRSFEVQQQAIDNVYSLLKPGGYFLSAENMAGPYMLQYYRKLRHKDTGWRYLNWDELQHLYQQFSMQRIDGFGLLPTNFSSGLLNRLCFFINKYILDFLPRRYKYISFVAARKN